MRSAIPGDRTWALDHHLALLYLEETPLARAGAHPDNIVRPEVIGPLERAGYARPQEFERVMRSEPRYVITVRAGAPAYLGEPRASALKQFLADRYELWRCAEPVCAFRRKSGP